MNLFAQHAFTVVRQIANHTDATTYYVRAVIRNAYTDTIIETLDLEDKGGQRFSKNWKVPADPSGEGFYISIVTSVYTDSDYTTKSGDYGDEENTYLVIARQTTKGGGGLAQRDVRDVVKEELAPITATLKALSEKEYPEIPEPKEIPMRWDEVISAINQLQKKLAPKEQKPVDLTPLKVEMKALKKAIADKEVTPETDLEPLKKHFDKAIKTVTTILEKVGEGLIKACMEGIRDELESVKWESTYVTKAKKGDTHDMKREGKEPQKAEEFDINSLSL